MAPIMDISADNKDKQLTIIFNASKNEPFKVTDGYKILQRKLKGNWKVLVNREAVGPEVLTGCSILVLPGPRDMFSEDEFINIKQFLDSGGNLMVLIGEGGEKGFHTNINFLLEEFGISINNDSVIRTHYYKYFHPKECLVLNGVLNKGIESLAGKLNHSSITNEGSYAKSSLPFIFPFGATLNVARPAVAVLSSGSAAYPANRPVCALYNPQDSRLEDAKKSKNGGRIVVLGSVHVFADAYLEKEANRILWDILLKFLLGDPGFELNKVDAEDPEVSDYHDVPDTAKLAERLRVCLQELDEIPADYTKLFDPKLFSISSDLVPEVLEAYSQLRVKYEPLQLIKPQFENPLPALQTAVFPPSFRELPNPQLELYDLDDAFSSEASHLAQLANKCILGSQEDENDLEYFIRECGNILHITTQLEAGVPRDASHILHHVAVHISEFKKLNAS
ncbi:intraflagellar transport protein 52 homolog [Ischnura elegans]|uniref:intraflagellar transport protein 52 homolog n=1 Tax=Ischnura elegans TaxID=197161 RepID=UPI001ED883AE|nr:intraflagellar transport protein 52 homolog [Ischnura elegans]